MSKKYQAPQFAPPNGGIVECQLPNTAVIGYFAGTPTASIPGYHPGALAFDITNGIWYRNTGSTTAATWTGENGGTVAAMTITTLTNNTQIRTALSEDRLVANAASALVMDDGTNTFISYDTRTTNTGAATVTFTGMPMTLVSAAAVHTTPTVKIAAKTVTYTGTNTVTSSQGAQLNIGIPTFTDASAGTITETSTMHVSAVAAAGGLLTLTNRRMITTGVSDCFLTNAGVWTDTACWEYGKEQLTRLKTGAESVIDSVLDRLVPATWRYKKEFETVGGADVMTMQTMDDRGRDRVGIIYDDLPEELRAPGEEKAVSAGVLASFALAALKVLRDQNRSLEARLTALGA